MTDQIPGAPAAAPVIPAAAPVDPAAPTPAAPDANQSAPSADPAATAPRKPDGRTRRINELTYEKHQLRRENDELRALAQELAKSRQSSQTQPSARPALSQFKTFEEYEDARDAWREAQKSSREPSREPTPRSESPRSEPLPEAFVAERDSLYEEGTEKYQDFEDVVASAKYIPASVASFILESDQRVELSYFLAKNQDEAKRIAKLSPMRQAAELARLEDKIALKTAKTTRPSSAPAPIAPVNGTGASSATPAAQMSDAEYAKARRSGKKLSQLLG